MIWFSVHLPRSCIPVWSPSSFAMAASFAAGVLAYMIATFNGGYLWHLVLFNEMYSSLKPWTRFDDVVIPLGAAAVCLQVSESARPAKVWKARVSMVRLVATTALQR